MPYIGRSTDGFGVRNRFIYLASSGATSVSGADANGATLTFTDGAYVDVYLNGVLLKAGTDYNTNTANTIASLSAMSANDEVTVIVYDVFTVGDMVSATSGGTFSGNVSLPDNVKLNIGAGPANNRTGGDLQIYHDGSKTVIDEDGTGALEIKSNRLYIRQANDELLADFRKDQYVRLYYDNTKRFETTDNGVEITGDIVFSGSGNGINLGVTSNTDSNTLDDYEEGTFTPAADSFSGTMTFTTARYIKIGKLIHVNFKMTSDGNSDTSQISISGFPFSATQEHPVSMSYDMAGSGNMQGTTTPSVPNAMINTAEIMYVYFPSGGAWQYSHMGTGFIRVSGTYIEA